MHITKVYFSNNVSSYGNFPFLFFISMINEVSDLEEKYAQCDHLLKTMYQNGQRFVRMHVVNKA